MSEFKLYYIPAIVIFVSSAVLIVSAIGAALTIILGWRANRDRST